MQNYTPLFFILIFLSFMSCTKMVENEAPVKQVISYYPKRVYPEDLPEKYKDKRLTYMDIYFSDEFPEGEEIDFEDLSEPEQEEFYQHTLSSESMGTLYGYEIKIIKPKDKRKLIAKKRKAIGLKNDGRDESISFLSDFDIMPTFPDCDLNNRVCFVNGVKKHFFKHFNTSSIKDPDLPKGELKVELGFTVNIDGHIVYAAANAPKRPLVLELVRVINLLPRMKPAELNGKKVAVKYQIPITIIVE